MRPRISRSDQGRRGGAVPAQPSERFIHEKLEAQREETGKVRALILQGRQQGCSTYVGGRYHHRTIQSEGFRTFILTHEDAATANLFEMINRFHDNVGATVKPTTGFANAKEFSFPDLDSGYKVGTAGTKGAGRSSTVQLQWIRGRLLAEP